MAINKEQVIQNRATPINYWRYTGLKAWRKPDVAASDDQADGAVIIVAGYTSKAARDFAKTAGRTADVLLDFLITNWKETIVDSRPATVEEKKAAHPLLELPEDEWEAMAHDMVQKITEIDHPDFNRFKEAYNTADEKDVVYEILKTHPHSASYFEGGVDV